VNENAGGYPTLSIKNSAFHITHFVLHTCPQPNPDENPKMFRIFDIRISNFFGKNGPPCVIEFEFSFFLAVVLFQVAHFAPIDTLPPPATNGADLSASL